jgi:DNA repair protein RadC
VPSAEDKALTNKALEAGKFLDITVCDHLIVSEDGYISLKDDGCF